MFYRKLSDCCHFCLKKPESGDEAVLPLVLLNKSKIFTPQLQKLKILVSGTVCIHITPKPLYTYLCTTEVLYVRNLYLGHLLCQTATDKSKNLLWKTFFFLKSSKTSCTPLTWPQPRTGPCVRPLTVEMRPGDNRLTHLRLSWIFCKFCL